MTPAQSHSHAVEGLNDTQKRVHKILLAAQNPLSAYEVLDKMRSKGAVTPPTVYRSLERLIEKGLAHRLESLNAYVACKHPHHHDMAAFAICEACGLVTEFTDPQIDERLTGWSDAHSFRPSKVTVEVRGLCGGCCPERGRP
ncbi:Fur family transcriptional regulator [Microvirga thermotolerans]|uniref:Ferric uptake regulation protein n=1 Tax=Microvirga thermotolerans TaxID=2651334 RepID=A0A5P9JRF4_9HYPH|nr:Fur family transcriptional regulator [Microvirga thermotolerans]QFU15312.1 transcriptional repressor [Microvirga thermotolerans]